MSARPAPRNPPLRESALFTRDSLRFVLGFVGLLAGFSTLIGGGSPAVVAVLHSVWWQGVLGGSVSIGGACEFAALWISGHGRGDRRGKERRADSVEVFGTLAIGASFGIVALVTMYHYASTDWDGTHWRAIFAGFTPAAAELGIAMLAGIRFRRITRDAPLPSAAIAARVAALDAESDVG